MEPPDEETQKLLDELEDNLRSKISDSGKVICFKSGNTHLNLFKLEFQRALVLIVSKTKAPVPTESPP